MAPRRNFTLRTGFCLLVLAAVLLSSRAAAQTNATAVASANNAFACDLYSKLKSSAGNLFFSPYSISTCLGMVDLGARGNTATQMSGLLHLPPGDSLFHTASGALQKELNAAGKAGGFDLSVANALWGQQGHPFLPGFLDLVKQDYEANLNQVDFQTKSEPARMSINSWVSDRTAGRIKDLLAPGVLSASTRLVLVNAIYFKGKWLTPFKPEDTTNADFTTTMDKRHPVPFMHTTSRFNYAENDEMQLLEMRYAGNRLSMVVILPKKDDGLPNIENGLDEKKLSALLAPMSGPRGPVQVSVYLPKFKLTGEFSLGKTLADLGMSDAFTSRADFSGMDGSRDLYLSAVVHKAYVDVNEEGTEAAAATGAAVSALAIMRPAPIPVFRADHPFLFLIRDRESGSILFLGRVTNPIQ